MYHRFLHALSAILLLTTAANFSVALTQTDPGVIGLWREPGGSVLDVHPCGNNVCARLVFISANAPSHVDGNNPDPAQRSRPLCGLQIGWGFHLKDPDHAADGFIYDPRSGSSYHGSLTADGDHLNLRGWAGFRIFGRTETWTRLEHAPPPCRP